MKATEQTVQQIERAIRKTAQKFPTDSENSVITDIHIKVSPESGEMVSFDDDDMELNRCVVEQWIDCNDDDFYTHVTTLLTNTLKRMSDTIDQMGIMKPFSFVLEDDDRNTVADLYLADDDTVIIGDDLMKDNIDEEDLASLVIQQIEFCNIILLNKAAEVEPKDLDKLKHIIKAIQPKAEIFECNYGDVDLDKIVNTRKFDWETVATSAGWIQEIEAERNEDHHEHDDHDDDDHDDDDEHEHDEHEHHHHHDHDHHHHHHHDDEGEAEEYGIGTFVYYSRKPFDLGLFDDFVARKWPRDVVRAKGICYFADERDMCYVFEQAGRQKTVKQAGQWIATMPKDQLDELLAREEQLRKEWDDKVGDRMIKIVFIGQHLQKEAICKELDKCLVD